MHLIQLTQKNGLPATGHGRKGNRQKIQLTQKKVPPATTPGPLVESIVSISFLVL